ncbi:DUF2213 domain-containing protein [Burkholderia gladioli]|uniref:DUF2213 domain-containing protein n=1 Tax=Burkholderia gladioli TaxID=28095 RepID=UPI001EE090CE|nr:DUF2213 domain-containing protein [Burkholderia gladioli]
MMKTNKDEIIVAFDKATVRSFDKDGRMRVSISRISKADVNPYWGKEIVGGEELGLEPDRVYYVFRPPEELEKAAPTFNNLPILAEHKFVSADSPEKDLIIGTTGSNASFDGEYLTNDLAFWDAEYIGKIESEEQRELSSSYRYTAIKKSGTYNGAHYDIVMTDIIGNHVATVPEGRAGRNVLVADSRFQPTGRVRTVKLNPKQMAALKARLPKLKVAMDEGLDTDGVVQALEQVVEEVQELADPAAAAATDADGNSEIAEMLKQVLAKLEAKPAAASDEDDEAAKKKAAEDEVAARAAEAKKADEAKNAAAMDAKIADATKGVRESIEGRFRAAQKVEPITGRVDAMAFDSAEAIYAHALKVGGMDPEKHEKVAYAGIVDVLIQTKSQDSPRVAHDAASGAKLLEMFPALGKITQA